MSAGDTSSSEQEPSISQPVPPAGSAGAGDKPGALTWFVCYVEIVVPVFRALRGLTANMFCRYPFTRGLRSLAIQPNTQRGPTLLALGITFPCPVDTDIL